MDFNEGNIRIFKLRQEGKEYIISLSIIGEFVRISGQEYLGKESNFYETEFSLADLSSINRYFLIMNSIQEAQNELIKAIEKQKVGIEFNKDVLKVIFYIVIGTDKIIFKLPLARRDNIYKRIKKPEEQEPFSGTIQLKNRGNYPEDEQRISILEKNNEQLKISQYNLITDIQKLLELSEKLKKETNLLYEENAKLGVRLQQIQKENYERNIEVDVLKDEEQALNEENIKLRNYNEDLEKVLDQKKENLKRNYMESMEKKYQKDVVDSGNGPKAISSRYDEALIKTYIPRVTAKPISDAYDEAMFANSRPPFYYTEKRITQYLANNNMDRLNRTDININIPNNIKNRGSFRTNNNDYNPNNLSYNTYNKIFDNEKLNGNDSYNNFSDVYYKEPENNQRRKKKKLPAYERISERTNDYEEDNNNYIQDNNTSYNHSQKDKEMSTYSEYQERSHILEHSELKDDLNYIKSEIIKSGTEEEMLLNKINRHGKNIHFNLIYKAINDTDRAEIFHEKCDKAERTLVLVETIDEKRFGGYTTQSWEGNGIDKKDDEAFVFTLDKLQIYNIITGQPAIGCYPKYGPVFLGCQIKVNDNFFVKGGTTYKKNTNYATNSDFELNNGVKFYGIKDIEVFEVNLI